MSQEKHQDTLPIISPRFGGGQCQDTSRDSIGNSPHGSVKDISVCESLSHTPNTVNTDNSNSITEIEMKLPHIGNPYETPHSQLSAQLSAQTSSRTSSRIIDTNNHYDTNNNYDTNNSVAEQFEEVDTFKFDDLLQRKTPQSNSGTSTSTSFHSGSSTNSSCRGRSKIISAKANKMGYFIECSDIFLSVCGLGADYKSHSIISLVKFTTPEKLQQQAYMLDNLATSTAEAGRDVKWVAGKNEWINLCGIIFIV